MEQPARDDDRRRGVLGPARRMVAEKRFLKRSLRLVGARLNAMKIAPIMRELAQHPNTGATTPDD